MNTKNHTEKFYNISKIDVNDPIGTVTLKTHDKDYVQVDQTIKCSTKEQRKQIDISSIVNNETLTIKVIYPELNVDKIGNLITNNFYFGTSVTQSNTDPCPEVSHTI